MNVLEAYFVRGRRVSQIAGEIGQSADDVRDALRKAGVSIRVNADEDQVTAAAKARGFASFADFARRNSLRSKKDQALALGVSRSAISTLHNAYRQFVASQFAGRRDA